MQLDLSHNRLCGVWLEHGSFGKQMGTYTAEGILAIAEALKVTGSLTKLDVRYNFKMGEEGEAALRKAVEGRSGFQLML